MEKLPIEFKEKWIAALRSGEYEQGEIMLHYKGTFCCIGVACVISGYSLLELDETGYAYSFKFPRVPDVISGSAAGNNIVKTLANMNDGTDGIRKHSFLEIADYIEANL